MATHSERDDLGVNDIQQLRDHYATGHTKPIPWRLEQLRALRQLLHDHRSDLADALASDLGKPATEAFMTEVDHVGSSISHMLKNLRSWTRPQRVHTPLHLQPGKAYTLREPLGLVLIIGPFNYPVQLTLGPLAGALAAGNCVVLKPSEQTPIVSRLLAKLINDYVDNRAVCVVQGGAEVAEDLLDEKFDHIFFTGSARVGRIVAAAAAKHLTTTTLELGGKSPAIVEPPVDMKTTAKRIAWAKFLNAGQTCIAPDYVIALGGSGQELIGHLHSAVQSMYGHSPAASPDYGRIVNEKHFDRLTAYLRQGRCEFGGGYNRDTRYVAPTVLSNVDPESPVMQEEIFGPILPVVELDNIDQAVDFVNAREKPLALYAFTRSDLTKRRLLTRTSSGGVGFGAPMVQFEVPNLPFGGVGESGSGAYHGEYTIDTFSHIKSVVDKPLHPDTLRAVYPPFRQLKDSIIRRLR
ncbi:aldehyde dehydrogenase family protein [Natronoglycomyces albus]|uniref:Aldehyde dehydrogenase n=1 Tax=Natronoglycomyces albus TaxID=2811108 RepID=A0A895XNX5_9ACTN|nr:aldehyde dehydrogenase family protein [Natronoglycomyces albus]QSB05243.1 aldehyde dehydrogenase family protein [Natronoglycomyces albus]